MVKPLNRTGVILALSTLAIAASLTTSLGAPRNGTASRPASRPAQTEEPLLDEAARRARALEGYYARTYSQPLADKNRLSKLIGVISLARIQGKPLTDKLIEMLGSPDVLVAQLAWESLHARHASLSEVERTTWIVGGFEIAKRGGFPGATIAPLLDAAASVPVASLKALPEPVLMRVAETNDPGVPDGKPALEAAGRAIAAWSDGRLVQTLISRMNSKPLLAPRIAAMLGGLPGAPTDTGDATARRAAWAKFSRDTRLTPPTTRPTYGGTSALIPPPERITDAEDPKWRRELELDELNLDAVELAFCIDATGSMADSNEFVIAYVETVARLLRVMSDTVRVATVYYRHEIDPAVMLDCCRSVPARPRDFFTKVLPLMPDATALVQQMRAQKPPTRSESGHKTFGAYVAGISTAMRGLQWSAAGTKIIVCTGDAKITPGSERAMVEVARAAKDGGFLLMFIVETPNVATEVAPASRAGIGLEPLLYKTDVERLERAKAQEQAEGMNAAIDRFKGSSFEAMTFRVLELTLPQDYRDRVRPLMAAVLPILAAQDASDRAARLVSGR